MARRPRQSRYRRGYINMADTKSVDALFRELRQDAEARAAARDQPEGDEPQIDLTIPDNSARS